jgi:hypothetical protein
MAATRRGFDYAQRKHVAEDLKAGKQPYRGRSRLLSSEKITRIHRLLQTSASNATIAKEVGCGSSTVQLERTLQLQQNSGRTGSK